MGMLGLDEGFVRFLWDARRGCEGKSSNGWKMVVKKVPMIGTFGGDFGKRTRGARGACGVWAKVGGLFFAGFEGFREGGADGEGGDVNRRAP
jgi:hypothetical protein